MYRAQFDGSSSARSMDKNTNFANSFNNGNFNQNGLNSRSDYPASQQHLKARISPSVALVELDESPSSLQDVRRSAQTKRNSVTHAKKNHKKINFCYHECFRYVEGKKAGTCGCGLPKDKHTLIVNEPGMKWSSEKCTKKYPTNAFGEIDFIEDIRNDNKRKPYIRISHQTDAHQLLTQLLKSWKLNTPNLVISVTGGAKSFNIKPKLKEAFSKGLIKVAVSTNAWIITGGTNAGVMKHVGEAVRQRGNVDGKINVLGVSPWGVLENSHMLIRKHGNRFMPAEYYYDTQDDTKTGLDFNHTHFILVDNGTTGQYGTEIELRSRVEETIAKDIKTSSNSSSGAIGIPVVILCLEGGPNSIKTMVEAIKHNTPAVVIDGTGRAADVVCFAYSHLTTDENGVSTIDVSYVDEVKEKVVNVFGTKLMEKVYAEIEELLRDMTMITVFRLEENGQCDMDLAILRALLKANKGNTKIKAKGMMDTIKKKSSTSKGERPTDIVYTAFHQRTGDESVLRINPRHEAEVRKGVNHVYGKFSEQVYNRILDLIKDKDMVDKFQLFDKNKQWQHEQSILNYLLAETIENEVKMTTFQAQLKLALAWNRIDVAESEIFTKELKSDHFKIEWLYESMFVALSNNKPDFVELFLNEGLSLKNFLTLERLTRLYNEIPATSAISSLMMNEDEVKSNGMDCVANIMQGLMGDRYRSRYKKPPYTSGIDRKDSSINPFKPSRIDGIQNEISGSDIENDKLPQPNLDLFTWAVLCNRKDLAYLLWTKSRDCIATAIMATKLLKKLADEISDNKELADMVGDLQEHASTYESLAVNVLDECRREKDDLAQMLVVKELVNIGGLTTLDIAVSANDRDFIAHPTCQTLLSRLWMGALYINTSFLRVFICVFLPFLINWFISFREDVEGTSQEEREDEEENVLDTIHENAGSVVGIDNEEFELSESRQSLSFVGNNNQSHHHMQAGGFAEDDHSIFDHMDDKNSESVEAAMTNSRTHSCAHRILHFYDAPFVKFVTNVISYSFFLLMYSTIICTRFELKINPAEYVLHGWALTLICEEIRQFVTQEPKSIFKKLEFYLSDPWNIFDMLSLFIFVVAAILRYVAYYQSNEDYLVASRIMFSVDIVLFFIRLLQIFLVNRHMGPKIVMIRRMLNDLGYFVIIMAVIIISYGVATQAVLYPNTRDWWEALVGVLSRPYWQMYGELFYEDIFEDKLNQTNGIPICKQPGADEPCPDEIGRYAVAVFMALYMLFTNILLLNLLIAIFNSTFEKVQEDSDKVWKFSRYDLISEYHGRPLLCPPFIILSHVYMFFYWLTGKCCCKKDSRKGSSLKITLEPEKNEPLTLWEYGVMEMYCIKKTKKEAETQDEQVKTILTRVNTLSEDIEGFRAVGSASSNTVLRPDTRTGTRGGNIEKRIAKMESNIEYILELLINQNQKKDHLIREISNESHGINNPVQTMRNMVTSLHTKARIPTYPSTTISRFKVPDDKVSWETSFSEYAPVKYTAPFVLAGPYWADVDLMEMKERPILAYNEYDDQCQVNRKSHTGIYQIVTGLPRNPFGRTGIIGRGSLGRFGPNHAADPIATRWRRTSSGIETDNGKRILEFIAIMRKDNCQWAIPGGMVEPGQNVSETLRREFTEEALAKLDMTEDQRNQLATRINYLFRNGKEVYQGYVDDPRNTDNAWMETVACNFHDETGDVFGEFQLKAGDDAQAVRWQRVSGNIPLFASHVGILEQVARMHNAAFY